MTLNEKLLKRLIETPGVPGREERQREIAREELETLTDEVRTDPLGSVIGTKQGRDDARVMVAAHLDEIGFLVKYIDDKGFLRLQTLGGTIRRTWSRSASWSRPRTANRCEGRCSPPASHRTSRAVKTNRSSPRWTSSSWTWV